LGVLVFVDQHVFETFLILPQHFRMFANSRSISINRSPKSAALKRLQPRLIGLVELQPRPLAKLADSPGGPCQA